MSSEKRTIRDFPDTGTLVMAGDEIYDEIYNAYFETTCDNLTKLHSLNTIVPFTAKKISERV
jgi:hypothetical protein